MKVTYNWLKEFVDVPWSPEELAEILTVSGSEVESVDPVPSLYDDVVVGKIKEVNQHPDSDHLSVCAVDCGKKPIQIVCGAPNVQTGMIVPVAQIGAKLHNDVVIKKAKIRGVISHGMICSEKELGISEISDKIMELTDDFITGKPFIPGDLRDDSILHLFINPNRPDCLSVYGLAREISALSGQPLKMSKITLPRAKQLAEGEFRVDIFDAEKCPRYSGVIIKNLTVKPSPFYIQQRLFSVGIRPINNIVDATNYNLIEWGHPLHAFDLKKLRGNRIIVKTAKNNQKFDTLDNETRELNDEMIMICDNDRAVAVGGIMGGINSEITDETTDIFLESAYFQPNNIQRSSKFLGLDTDASHRFERGMDPNFTLEALKRTCALILKLSSGQIYKPFFDEYPNKISNKVIELKPGNLNNVLGTDFSKKQIVDSLCKIELKPKKDKDKIKFAIPTFRHDLTREIDLIEEVARVIGLDKIPSRQTAHIQLRNISKNSAQSQNRLRTALKAQGFLEVYTYSMIDSNIKEFFRERGNNIFLKNPISPELSMLRPSLIPGLLNAAKHNINRGKRNLRLFEIGKVFARDFMQKKGKSEALYISGVVVGQRIPYSWDGQNVSADIFTLKGIVESFFRKISLDIVEFISYDCSYMEQSLSVKFNDIIVGSIGKYKNKCLVSDFDKPVFVFELDAEKIIEFTQKDVYYKPYSKFPAAKRDLAFVIPLEIPVKEILDTVKKAGKPILQSVSVEDVYTGKPLAENNRSVRISLKFFSYTSSLLDEEVEKIINEIIHTVKEKHNINIRY
ncbi:phenylalanine--tRNA ligase subunit beta [candidate division KSB1 bacterium]